MNFNIDPASLQLCLNKYWQIFVNHKLFFKQKLLNNGFIYVYEFCRHFYLKQLREQYMSFKLYKPMAVLQLLPCCTLRVKEALL